jgi:hypothetical protein
MADETPDFKELCFQAREALLPFEPAIRRLAFMGVPIEASQNIELAFRHLEDCRMRLGKAIQAYDGGTSVYPR